MGADYTRVVQPPEFLQLCPSSFSGLVCEMLAERWWLREVDADYRKSGTDTRSSSNLSLIISRQAWFVKYKLNVGGFVGGCCLHNTVVQPPDILQLYPSSFPGLLCEMLDERWWLSEEGADTAREWSSHQSFLNFVPHHFQAWFGTYKLDSVAT